MFVSRSALRWLRTVSKLVVGIPLLACAVFLLVVTVSHFASAGGLITLSIFGLAATLHLGSTSGLLGGGFGIGCKMFFSTVVSTVAWVVAHGLWPGLPMWPFVLTGLLVVPLFLLYFVLPAALKVLAEHLRIEWALLIDRFRNR